jgi:soluble P-type ATPase
VIEIEIPGRGQLRLVHAVLDVNGTIACDGGLLPGVASRLQALASSLKPHLITGNTYGKQDEIDRELGLRAIRLPDVTNQARKKAEYVEALGEASAVAIGNRTNDARMLKAALGIAVVGHEGAARATVLSADVVVPDIEAALDLLLQPRRLVATLRT